MKKTRGHIFLIITLLFLAAGLLASCGSSEPEEEAQWPAMDSLEALSLADISSVEYLRATEGGAVGDTVTDATQIENICLRLKEVRIAGETDEGVDDDGLSIGIKTGEETLGFSFEGDILILDGPERYRVENLSSLKSYIDGLIEEKEAAAGTSETAKAGKSSETATTAKPSGDGSSYDIEKGASKRASEDGSIVYIYFNDFMMTMPNNDKYSYEASGDSVSFYLWAAKQEGYGGHLVTIKAYDMDDDSYEDLPSYHVAGKGKNVDKRFIAIYPTDVQWNMEDADQTTDYRDLFDYLQKIGEGAVNSPLQTAGSVDGPQ